MKKEFLYGRRIKELREQRGWTQEQLATIAGIESARTIQRVERDETKAPETLLAIAAAFDVDLSQLRITRRIAESELRGTRLVTTVKDFIAAENANSAYAFAKSVMVPLKPESEIEDRIDSLMRQVFADREYIERDDADMWESYLDCIKEPLGELFSLGLAFFLVDERRDILLRAGHGLTPSEDHIPDWGIRYYLLVTRHGCFQLDKDSPLHRFNESCKACGATLLTMIKQEDAGVIVYANALWTLGESADETKVCWCDTCFPIKQKGSRLGLGYMEQVTGIRREQLQSIYEAVVGGEPFIEGLS